MTGKRARAAQRPHKPDMIRDAAITALGGDAVKDRAIIAVIIYETSDGRICAVAHDGTASAAEGLLRKACEMAGIEL